MFENCFSPQHPDHAGLLVHVHRHGLSSAPTSWRCATRAPLGGHVKTLAEILGEHGYNTTCVGFSGNPASRGFQKYLDFSGWGSWEEGRSPKAENLNEVAIPELKRLAGEDKPFFLFLRHMDPHSPYLPPRPFERMFYDGDECDPEQPLAGPGHDLQAVLRLLRELVPAAAAPTRTTSSPSTTARSPTWTPASRTSSQQRRRRWASRRRR